MPRVAPASRKRPAAAASSRPPWPRRPHLGSSSRVLTSTVLAAWGGSIGCGAEDGDRPRAADGPGGTGLRRAAAGRLGDPAASYAGVGSNPAAAVGFGVGTGPGALPAGIQPAGSVPEAAARRRRVG